VCRILHNEGLSGLHGFAVVGMVMSERTWWGGRLCRLILGNVPRTFPPKILSLTACR
jgi:hypothetical protein